MNLFGFLKIRTSDHKKPYNAPENKNRKRNKIKIFKLVEKSNERGKIPPNAKNNLAFQEYHVVSMVDDAEESKEIDL